MDLFSESEATSKALTRYLSRKIVVESAGQRWPVRWLGHEITPKGTWLYLEVMAPKAGWGAATVRNTLFFELEPTQINVLTLRDRGIKRSVSFTRSSAPVPLAAEPD